MASKIKIIYLCTCMQDEGSFFVRARSRNEDITEWMAEVRAKLGDDHRARNSLCTARKVKYLKVPMTEGAPIGEPVDK